MADPFCSVAGCLEPAAGAVLLPYAVPRRTTLCEEHLRPIRQILVAVLDEPNHPGQPVREVVEPVRSAPL